MMSKYKQNTPSGYRAAPICCRSIIGTSTRKISDPRIYSLCFVRLTVSTFFVLTLCRRGRIGQTLHRMTALVFLPSECFHFIWTSRTCSDIWGAVTDAGFQTSSIFSQNRRDTYLYCFSFFHPEDCCRCVGRYGIRETCE